MTIAIKVENLSKAYQIGQIGTGTISRDIERWFVTKVMGREDPFLKLGQVNDRTIKGETDVVWSLKDINLEIEQGDTVGIIGRNGAGKSTLLKLLSRVTSPTTGSIKIKGRVASLLEVGTGFHSELTGRENIYLNGSILGMRKKEIDCKLEEIVDFSGVERYIDTPVKRYSSGMIVRLAFAVAAHLDSEILIVDEVLAVGDAEFQKKCLGKMNDISTRYGRTILFVSHNMAAVENLCPDAIILMNGLIYASGTTSSIIPQYNQSNRLSNSLRLDQVQERKGNQNLRFVNAQVIQNGKVCSEQVESLMPTDFRLCFEVKEDLKIKSARIDVGINDDKGQRVGWFSTSLSKEFSITNKTSEISFRVSNFNLAPGDYTCNIYSQINGEDADWLSDVFPFVVIEKDYYDSGNHVPRSQGILLLQYSYSVS
jgi:lipopolysaccharide transport system ATP-binding protein